MTRPIDRATRPARAVDQGAGDEVPEPIDLDSDARVGPRRKVQTTAAHLRATHRANGLDDLDDPSLARAILLAATLLVLVCARGYWGSWSPLGNDASSHITTIATFASRLASGDGWWSTDYNLGFPLGLYYQPLPHLVSGLLCWLVGGATKATLVYKLLLTVVVTAQPWTVYYGLRRAGGDHLTSALAGLMSVLVMDSYEYGYTTYASLSVGLFTQAWGNTALPLALGELVRLCRGQGRLSTTIAASALLASCHMFYAIALVPPILVLAPVFTLTAPPNPLDDSPPGPIWERLGVTWLRLSLVGIGAFAILSAWLIPLASTQAFFGGWPFGRETRVDGYGWWYVWNSLTDGTALDGANRYADAWLPTLRARLSGVDPVLASEPEAAWHAPVMTAFAWVGAAALLVRRRAHPIAILGLTLAVWSAICVAGRATFGGIIDAYPLHASVQIFRYGALLQFSLVLLAAWGIASVAELLSRIWSPEAAIVFMAGSLAVPVAAGARQMDSGFTTIDRSLHLDPESYTALGTALRRAPLDGRMLVGPSTGTRGHFHGGLLSWVAQRPAGQSYGVGLHDSLGFYYLEFFDLQDDRASTLADLYDFRVMVSSPSQTLPGLRGARTLWGDDRYRVSTLPVTGTSIAVMREDSIREGTPREQRAEIRRWLNGNGPELGTTIVLDVQEPRSREALVGAPVSVSGELMFDELPPVGEVLSSGALTSRVIGRVLLTEPGLAVFKVGYHPFWRVTVDGEPAETVYAYPCYLAVRLGPGEHELSAEFRWPGYTRFLLLLAPLTLLGFWGFERTLLARLALRMRRRRTGAQLAVPEPRPARTQDTADVPRAEP